RTVESRSGINPSAIASATAADFGRREQLPQYASDPCRCVSLGINAASESETLHPERIVRLIMPMRHNELRNARIDRLCHRANTTWVHQSGAARQYLAEREIGEVPHFRR